MAVTAMMAELETALNCIFDPSTSTEDKKKIQENLDQFKSQPDSLNLCYHMLTFSKNQYVLWYAASVLEDAVNRRWRYLSTEDKRYLREFTFDQILQNFYILPPFVSTKLAKVLVDIGKLEWPEEFPEFLPKVEAVMQNKETCRIGLSILVLIAEEFGSENALLPAMRKQQLQCHLIGQFPSILSSLTMILNHAMQILSSHSGDASSVQEEDAIASMCLKCIIQLVGWAPIATDLTPQLVTLMFQFAVHRTQARHQFQMTNSSVVAVECLTEMMTKRCSPKEFDHFLVELTKALMVVLESLTEQQASLMNSVGDEYLTKVTEFLNAFLFNHFSRLVQNSKFPLSYFLQLLLSFTCLQPTISGFKLCLQQWGKFVDLIAEAEQLDGHQQREALDAYENGLSALLLHLVDRTRFSSFREQLDELDDEIEGEYASDSGIGDNIGFGIEEEESHSTKKSELQEFIDECIQLIARIAELPSCAPRLLELLIPQFQNYMANFSKIRNTAAPEMNSEAQVEENYFVRDLTTCCKMLAIVAGHYYIDQDPRKAWEILNMFIDLGFYICKDRLHTRAECFVGLQETVSDSIRLSTGCIEHLLKAGNSSDIAAIADKMVDYVVSVLDTKIIASPEIVMTSVINLLNSLTWIIPPEILHSVPCMQALKTSVHTISHSLPLSIQAQLYSAISNSLLPASLGSRTAVWTARVNAYNEFASPIVTSVQEIANTIQHNDLRTVDPQILSQIVRNMRILGVMATSVRESPKPAKDAYHQIIVSALPAIITILTMCLKQKHLSPPVVRVANEILTFYIRLLAAIRKELKSEFIGQTVTTFISIFQEQSIVSDLGNLGRAGTLFLYRFLELLTIVMEEPTSVFSSFLQSETTKGSLIPEFLTLMLHVLEKHYRFFFVTDIQTDGSRRRNFASEGARQYFNAIWEAIGCTLQNVDVPPRVVRQVIALLERINEVHCLFSLDAFKEGLRMAYLQTFMEFLLNGSMNLLKDEICLVIFHMAAVDFVSFYKVFIPGFLNSKNTITTQDKEQLLQVLGRDIDELTFKRNIISFINDSKYLLVQGT